MKKHLWLFLALLVLVVAACAPTAQPSTEPLAETSNAASLLFLGNKNIAPVVYLDGNIPSGVAVDIAHALAKHISQPIEIRAMDWSEAQRLVANGEADALIQINATEERKKIYDFSDPFLESHFSIFIRTDETGILGASGLRGLRVGVESGGLPQKLLEKDPQIILVIIPNFLDGFKQLNEGAIDAVVVDYRVGSYVLAVNDIRNIRVTGEPIESSYSSIAVKKGNTKLLNEINSALRAIKDDGTYQRILSNWKPTEVVFETQQQITRRIYLTTTFALLVLLLIAVIWVVTIKRELTKRKAAEKKIGEQYSTLHSILESENASIFSVDSEYRYTSFNNAHVSVMKRIYNAEIETGRSLLGYMTVMEDREKAKHNLDRALAGERLVESEYSGEEMRSRLYFEISHNPILTEDGTVIGAAVLARDITERKQAEKALEESEKRYRELFENANMAIFQSTLDGKVIMVNPEFARMFGYESPKEVAATVKDVGTDLFADPQRRTEIIRLRAEYPDLNEFENLYRRKDGSTFLGKLHIHSVMDSDGGLLYFEGFIEDITERKRIEQERSQNLRYFESMDKVNRTLQSVNDLEQMMNDVLDEVLSIFDCDRAFLAHPLDPDAESYSGAMIRCRPEYPTTHSKGAIIPMDPLANKFIRAMLASEDPVQIGPESAISLTEEISKRFDFKSIMGMALYPKVDTPWEFAINQCSHARVWRPEEERLFKEIGRRVSDALSSLLSHRNLLASEERFRRLTENARDVIYRMSLPDGRYEYVSPAALSVFGYSPEEFYNTQNFIKKALHPDWHAYFEDQWEHLIKGEMPPTYEYQIIHKSGEARWLNQRNILVRDNTGNPIAIEGIVTDITERKRAEEALRINEERYRMAQAMGHVGNWEYNLQTTEFWGSDEAKRIYGFDLESSSFTTDEVENCIPERERVHRALVDLIEADKPYNLEFEIHPKNSSEPKIISSIAELKRDEHGSPLLVTGVIQDITERKQAEEKLQETERVKTDLLEKLNEAQQIAAIGSWEWNVQTNHVWWSDETYRVFGVTPQDYVPSFEGNSRFIHADDLAMYNEAFKHSLQTGEPLDVDLRLVADDGLLKHCHAKGKIVYDASGQPIRFMGTIMDVTERRQSERKIRRQIDYLTALQDIDRAIVAAFEMRPSLNALISKSISLLAVDAAAISLTDLTMNSLEFAAGDGFRTNAIMAPNLKLSESYAGRVTSKQHIVKIPNPKNEPDNLFLTDFFKGEDFVSYYGVPLIAEGKAIGVLEVFQRSLVKHDQEWLDFLNALAGQAAVAISNAQLFDSLQHSNSELIHAYDATIEGWSRALDLRDKETEGHSKRVTEMTVKLARAFGLSEAELVQVRWGALLHDIGKMGVPDGILHKSIPLTDEEWMVMKKHPTFAYELLAPVRYLRLALDIPHYHHEKWDGSGYPYELKGEQIPLTARIFAVVDVWDALTSDRPYRPAWTKEKTREHIRAESGKHFDPQVVELFMQMPD
jgi:PAS domain S-box-containing protein/putative nucleotidyltransferase with HDIG domain